MWTDDPILTIRGQAGAEYKGNTPVRMLHLNEVRNRINELEINLALPTTTWKEEIEKTKPVRFYHILEARKAIENILTASNMTLYDYLNYDEEGNKISGSEKTIWTDPILNSRVPVRAIHIEELRCPLRVSLPCEIWNRGSDPASSIQITNLLVAGWCDRGTVSCFSGQGVPWDVFIEDDNCCLKGHKYNDISYKVPEKGWCYSFHGDCIIDYWNAGKFRRGVNCHEIYRLNTTYRVDILVKPLTSVRTQRLLDMGNFRMVELTSDPTLVDETYGYPCLLDISDMSYIAQPKIKSAGFLEDAILTGNSCELTKLVYSGDKVAWKKTQNATTQRSIGIEDHFHSRNIDYWGAYIEPPLEPCAVEKMGGDKQFVSSSIQGIKSTNSHSIYVPEDWCLKATDTIAQRKQKLKPHKIRKEFEWTMTQNNVKWNVNLSGMQSILGIPTTVNDPFDDADFQVWFGAIHTYSVGKATEGHFLLAKDDGVEFVAKDKDTTTLDIFLDTTNLIVPASDVIDISVKLTINGIEWFRVDDLTPFSNTDHVFKCVGGVITFAGGLLGNRKGVATNATLDYYYNPVPFKFYASGNIVVTAPQSTKVYMMLNYYNVPYSYLEYRSPINYYLMEFLWPDRYYLRTLRSVHTGPGPAPGASGPFDSQLCLPYVATALRPMAIKDEEYS